MTEAEEAELLVGIIRPMLAHKNPGVIGSTLADLVATLIASHHPELRETTERLFFELVRDLVPLEIEDMIKRGVVGADWRGTQQ